jgi:hypothetical protein
MVGYITRNSRDILNIRARSLNPRHTRQKQFWDRLQDTIYTLNNTWDYIMRIYYDNLLPIFLHHLDLMSFDEIECRSAAVPKYWLRHWRVQSKHDTHLIEIEDQRKAVRKARNKMYDDARKHSRRLCIGQRIDPANEPMPHEIRWLPMAGQRRDWREYR